LEGDLRGVTKELTVSSRNQAPGAAPLSNWGWRWYPWSGIRRGIVGGSGRWSTGQSQEAENR